MTIEHPIEDEVTELAQRVEKARGKLAYQFDPALTEALSEDELHAERELAERIRGQDRGQRWKQAQAAAAASDRARQTTEEIEKADIRDLLLARKAIAAQRRESSPHAKLASLYRHRSWSLRALAGVVGAGMLWSAVNVQHNIAPGGPTDPLYWFSYLLEAMISVCLIIIMIGTNKVAEWGVVDNRRQVAMAEIALLALTVSLNTYPYLRAAQWYDAAVHAIAPIMIGVALLIHDAASGRFGLAISRATVQVRDLPDPAEQIRRTMPSVASYRLRPPMPAPRAAEHQDAETAELEAAPTVQALESADHEAPAPTAPLPVVETAAPVRATTPTQAEKSRASGSSSRRTEAQASAETRGAPSGPATTAAEKSSAPAKAPGAAAGAGNRATSTNADARPATPAKTTTAIVKTESRPATPASRPAAPKTESRPPTPASRPSAVKAETSPAAQSNAEPAKTTRPAASASSRTTASAAAESRTAKPAERPSSGTPAAAAKRKAAADNKKDSASTGTTSDKDKAPASDAGPGSDGYDTGQFRIAEILEQELAELQAARRKARTSRQRLSQQSGRDR